MRLSNLPNTWRWVTLDYLAAPIPNAVVDGPFGSNLKVTDYVKCGIPVLQGKNITNDMLQWCGIRYVSEHKANELRRSAVRLGDILIVKIGSIGYSAIITDLHGYPFALIPANLAKVTPNISLVETKYLHHWLKTSISKNYLEGVASKTAQPALSLTKIRELPVPLPPLPEQRRIAAILDQAEALRAKRRRALARLDVLTQSIFFEMFGDPVTNPKRWDETLVLGEVSSIVSGITKGRIVNGSKTREIPYLAVLNVQDRALNLSFVKTIEATEDEIRRYKLQKDDLMLTEGGDPDKLGRGTLWNNEIPECIHQNHVFRVRLTTNRLSPLFLNWLVGSQRGKKYFLRSAKQTTGIASINMTQLRGFPLLLPPLEWQTRFEEQVKATERLKGSQRASLEKLDALFASLQHRAFRGEL